MDLKPATVGSDAAWWSAESKSDEKHESKDDAVASEMGV